MNNVFKNIMVWKKQSKTLRGLYQIMCKYDWYNKDTYERNINLVKKNENILFEI